MKKTVLMVPMVMGIVLGMPAVSGANPLSTQENRTSVATVGSTAKGSVTSSSLTEKALTENATQLSNLIRRAIGEDYQRISLYHQADAQREMGIASATYMDPKLRFGAANVPVDSWSLTDDSMTNLTLGVSQQFPRGDTLQLQKEKAFQQADVTEDSVQLRGLAVAQSVSRLWLQLGYLKEAHSNLSTRIELQRQLVRQLETNYALGKKSVQDVLSVELAVSTLEEKLDLNWQQQQQIQAQLSEWLGADWLTSNAANAASNQVQWQSLDGLLSQMTVGDHYPQFKQHPLLHQADKRIAIKQTDIALQEQNYKPQWGIEVAYGDRRASSMTTGKAPDVASAFITLDIPLFTSNKQDRSVNAAKYELGSARLDRDLLIQKMNAQVNGLLSDLNGLQQRTLRYCDHLLPQSQAHLAAVKRAYDSNTASFAEWVAANVNSLALQLDYQQLVTQTNQTKADLAYWLNAFPVDVIELTHQRSSF